MRERSHIIFDRLASGFTQDQVPLGVTKPVMADENGQLFNTDWPSPSGEINTASNLGGGLANFNNKVGSDLQFNSFASSDFDLSGNVISIDATLKATWNGKQDAISLTTTGTSGVATLVGNVINIPNYTYTLPIASTSVLGGVKVDGTTITITGGVISSVGGTTYTASNGLTLSTADFQLGGTIGAPSTLLHDSYIDPNGKSLYLKGVLSTGNGILEVQNTGTGKGIEVSTVSDVGVNIISGSTGLYSYSSAGNAIYAYSVNNPSQFYTDRTSTNTVGTNLVLLRVTPGSGANGIGQSIEFDIQTSSSLWLANELISKWTDATDATRTSQFIITGVNSAVTADLFTLSGNGGLRLNKYGVNTFAGTPTYTLGVDASGNVVEFTSGTGGGTVTSFTFTDGNGFDGTVTNSTTTPTLALTTTITNTHVLYSNSGALAGSANHTWDNTNAILGITGQIDVNKTATSNSGGLHGYYGFTTINFNGVSASTGAVFSSNVQFLTANINSTQSFDGSANYSAMLNILRIGSTNTSAGTYNGTVSGTNRAFSSNGTYVQLDTLNNSGVVVTLDHVAGFQVFAPQASGGNAVASNLLASITNYYGILIAASDEYANASANITNRYAIKQVGTNDISSFAGVINSSNDIEITNTTKGVILKAPGGGRWRVTIDNTGAIVTTSI